MPHKKGSPEAKAWAEEMKKKRQQKQTNGQQKSDKVITDTKPAPSRYDDNDIAELKRQIEELKSTQFFQQPAVQNPQFTPQGSIVGTFEKYIVDPSQYPDPRERLAKEPQLARFAFDLNWELTWDITTAEYETLDRRRVKEPRFKIELHYIVSDDETGEPTDKRLIMKRLIMHEDPQASIVIARENGLEVDEINQKKFLDEMRYLRIRDWLLEAFYPPRAAPQRKTREEVIEGRLVEVYTTSSENSQSIPFGNLKRAKF